MPARIPLATVAERHKELAGFLWIAPEELVEKAMPHLRGSEPWAALVTAYYALPGDPRARAPMMKEVCLTYGLLDHRARASIEVGVRVLREAIEQAHLPKDIRDQTLTQFFNRARAERLNTGVRTLTRLVNGLQFLLQAYDEGPGAPIQLRYALELWDADLDRLQNFGRRSRSAFYAMLRDARLETRKTRTPDALPTRRFFTAGRFRWRPSGASANPDLALLSTAVKGETMADFVRYYSYPEMIRIIRGLSDRGVYAATEALKKAGFYR